MKVSHLPDVTPIYKYQGWDSNARLLEPKLLDSFLENTTVLLFCL